MKFGEVFMVGIENNPVVEKHKLRRQIGVKTLRASNPLNY